MKAESFCLRNKFINAGDRIRTERAVVARERFKGGKRGWSTIRNLVLVEEAAERL